MANLTRRQLLLSSTVLILPIGVKAAGAGNFSQESTQWLVYGTQVTQLLQQIALVTNAVNQYKTMLTNLIQLPGKVVNSVMQPVRDLADAASALSGAGNELYKSVESVGTVWQRRNNEMANLRLSPSEYWKQEMKLADNRGSIYKKQWDADIAALNAMETKIKIYQDLAAEIPNVEGNVQGIQLLNTQLNMASQELSGIHATLRSKSIADNQERMNQEQAKLIEAQRRQKEIERLAIIAKRNAEWQAAIKAPWEK